MLEYPKDIWKLRIKGKKKVEIVDRIFTELAKMYNIPKPDYGIYKIVTVKKPERTTVYRSAIFPIGSIFYVTEGYGEKDGFIGLILRSAIVSKIKLLHEFGHYLAYVKNGYERLVHEKWEKKARNFARNRRARKLVNRIIYEMNKT